ncbi:MAG TPA: c-type cytochrome [Acidimicrobiia bacterium]|jgi:ubiquinol-cytochrome c reductase cytochrome c subunit
MKASRLLTLVLLAVPLAVACAVVPAAAATRSRSTPRVASRPAQGVDDSVDPKPVFLADCAICHGSDARGTNNGPDLRGLGRASIDYELSTGRMPLSSPTAKTERRPPKYPPALQEALVTYVYDLAGGGGVDIPELQLEHADLAAGGELFRLNCAACHAWSSRGGALLEREAPSTHPATPLQIAEAIRVGPGTMPAFGTAAITDKQLNDIVAYVRYLRHPRDRGGNPLWYLGPLVEGGVAWIIGLGLLLVVIRLIGTPR